MRTFPAAFAAELAKKTGATPIWILRMTVNAVVYDLSDSMFNFPDGMPNGFSTTLPWISSWGEVRESISGSIGEMLISDFSVTVLVDQDNPDNIRHLALNHPLEQSPAELYLWFDGLTNATPPQKLFVGYVKDIDVPDETQVHLTIEDESTRFQKYLGTRISSEAYPRCDPDVVGKMIPIVFGNVSKLPALCVDSGWVTSITADISAVDTTITVSELPVNSVRYKIINIDDEFIYIQSVVGKVLTVTRAYGGTVAVVHTKGSTVIEKKSTPLVYLLADHALDSIGTVMARVSGINVDITPDVTKYLGTPDNQLAGYPGKAAITIPDFASVTQRISLAVNDSIAVNDASHSHIAGTVNTVVTSNLQQSIGGVGLHTTTPVNLRGYVGDGQYHEWRASVFWSFVAPPGVILTSTITITVSCPEWSKIYFAGILVAQTTTIPFTNQQISFTFSPTTQATAMNKSGNIVEISLLTRRGTLSLGQVISYDTWISASATVSTGTRNVSYNSNSSAQVTVASSPSYVSKSGTVSLSGNSVADITVGDMILADAGRNISSPAGVIGTILATYCNDTSLIQVGTFPDSYSINGSITEYKKTNEWLDYLSFQCRAFFRKLAGVSRLIVREVNPTVTGIIPACCLTSEGIKALSYKKAPITDVINKVKVLYSRDWTASGKQSESYMSSIATTDDVSIGIFGEQEQPNMFMFDFVTSSIMANDLASFYCDFYGNRKWRISFSTFLDNAAFEFGDIAQIPFANDLVGVLVDAGIAPGGTDKIDTMNFVMEAAILPATETNALVTLFGEQLQTKTREGLIYV